MPVQFAWLLSYRGTIADKTSKHNYGYFLNFDLCTISRYDFHVFKTSFIHCVTFFYTVVNILCCKNSVELVKI